MQYPIEKYQVANGPEELRWGARRDGPGMPRDPPTRSTGIQVAPRVTWPQVVGRPLVELCLIDRGEDLPPRAVSEEALDEFRAREVAQAEETNRFVREQVLPRPAVPPRTEGGPDRPH